MSITVALSTTSIACLLYGMMLSCFSVAGGLLAGWLDGRLGPKLALKLELLGVVASQAIQLGQTKTRLFYMPFDPAAHTPLWAGPVFHTLPDLALIGGGFVGAVSVTAAYASRRTMLTQVVPPAKVGVFFGLFSIAGLATSWLAPLLVEITTSVTHSQRAGLLPISGLVAAGFGVLLFVRGGDRLSR